MLRTLELWDICYEEAVFYLAVLMIIHPNLAGTNTSKLFSSIHLALELGVLCWRCYLEGNICQKAFQVR